MPRGHTILLCCLSGIIFGGCVQKADRHARAPAPGCIAAHSIGSTRVVNANQIDFMLRDRHVLRNTLPDGCRNLFHVGSFDMASSKPDICPGDTLIVRNRAGGPGEPGDDYCSLGRFAPAYPDAPR